MSGSMHEEGEQLIREGERILRRDAQNALREREFNMVVRRAQEGVELALKGARRSPDHDKAWSQATGSYQDQSTGGSGDPYTDESANSGDQPRTVFRTA